MGDAIYRAQGKTGSPTTCCRTADRVADCIFSVPKIRADRRQPPHARIGLIDIHWFANKLNNSLRNLQISPKVLPIFLLYNTFLYDTTPSNCCVLNFMEPPRH